MPRDTDTTRRGFFKLCLSLATLFTTQPSLALAQQGQLKRYKRVKLVDNEGRPIRTSDLLIGENYLFHYPYVTTPCFLLNLGKPSIGGTQLKTANGQDYKWQGGVGSHHSIVAFSAICSHKMSHPARSVSFINYRHDGANFVDSADRKTQREQIIYCCSENSVYDPAQGARVLGGPAPQPLASVLLEYDETDDALYATGIHGGDMFDKFLTEFAMRLSLEYGTTDIRKLVTDTSTTTPLADYCQNQVLC